MDSVFGKNKLWWFKTQQPILGTGTTAIWWVTEPHCLNTNIYSLTWRHLVVNVISYI
jgi:hypothetical protein